MERERGNAQTCRKKGPYTTEVQAAMHTRIAMGGHVAASEAIFDIK